MNEKRRKIIMAVFLALVFFSFFSFYTIAHPILPTDMDDWDFLCFHRDPVPQWRGWNPSRVFAEVTMPVVSMISRVLFFPITGNIFTALMTGFSISVSLVMTGLVFALCRMLRKRDCPYGRFCSGLSSFSFATSGFSEQITRTMITCSGHRMPAPIFSM